MSPGFLFVLACSLLAAVLPAQAAQRCGSPSIAARHLHHKVCVKAHVYQEINLDDGTRILDVCTPGTTASDCRFAFVSLNRNRAAVGSLKQYIGKEVEIRGEIRPVNGRAEILVSSAKQIQIHARAEEPRKQNVSSHRFRPNPALLKAFNATQSRMPVTDPAFRTNSRD